MRRKIFLAGIMQGSHRGAELHDQSYRTRLAASIRAHVPNCDVYDPLADHRNSLTYDDSTGRAVFLGHNRMCGEADAVIAFVPEASMGTAIEMWEAHRHGRVVITISPLAHNWTVKYLSDRVYPDLASFQADLERGEIARMIEASDRPTRAARHA